MKASPKTEKVERSAISGASGAVASVTAGKEQGAEYAIAEYLIKTSARYFVSAFIWSTDEPTRVAANYLLLSAASSGKVGMVAWFEAMRNNHFSVLCADIHAYEKLISSEIMKDPGLAKRLLALKEFYAAEKSDLQEAGLWYDVQYDEILDESSAIKLKHLAIVFLSYAIWYNEDYVRYRTRERSRIILSQDSVRVFHEVLDDCKLDKENLIKVICFIQDLAESYKDSYAKKEFNEVLYKNAELLPAPKEFCARCKDVLLSLGTRSVLTMISGRKVKVNQTRNSGEDQIGTIVKNMHGIDPTVTFWKVDRKDVK